MESNPLVTVFIPMYNAQKYIGECIDSILAQTYTNFEIVVIDDGSTDRSAAVVEAYQDTRIHLYRNNGNRGIPYTRNWGLDLAKGKYLAIMDADDIASPRRLEISVDYLERHPECRIVGGMCNYIQEGKICRPPGQIRRSECQNYCSLFRSPINNSSAMMDMEFIRTYGIRYNEKYFVAQDYDFFVQCLPYTKIVRLKERLIHYRISDENITSTSIREKKARRDEIIQDIQKKAYQNLKIAISEEEWELVEDWTSGDRSAIKLGDYPRLLTVIEKILNQVPREDWDGVKRSVQRRMAETFAILPISRREKRNLWKMAKPLHGNIYAWVVYTQLLKR